MDLKEFKADLKPTASKHEFISNKNIINKILFGNIFSKIKSRGIEFEDFRKYNLTDDASRIDWKASLKANQLLIRDSIEEKAINLLFLVDVSDTMLFSSGDKLKCEYAAEIVAGLSFAIQLGGYSSGICFFNDRIVKTIMPKGGSRQYFDIITELKKVENYGGGCSLKNAIKNLLSIFTTPTIIVIVSDFINLGDDWQKYIEISSLNHFIIGICVRDRLDRRLPDNVGYFTLEDPSSSKKIIIDTKEAQKNYNKGIIDDEKSIDRVFKRANSSYLIIETTEDYEKSILTFLEKKSKIIK